MGTRMAFLALIHSNGIVERDSKIIKVPFTNIRLSEVGDEIPDSSEGSSADQEIDITFTQDAPNVFITKALRTPQFPSMPFLVSQDSWYNARDSNNQNEEYAWINEISMEKAASSVTPTEEEMINPTLIPPKIFIAIPDCHASICAELNGLLTVDSSGVSALTQVWLGGPEIRGSRRIRITIIAKQKAVKKPKARLRVRGGAHLYGG